MAGGFIGDAKVRVGADASGFANDAASQMRGPLAKLGSTVADAFSLSFKAVAATAATGITATVGTALAKGFQRSAGLDTARGRLAGIGIEGKTLEAVMKQVDKAVTGTTASMADGAQAASLMMTSGVKGGKQLEGALDAIVGLTEATGAEMSEITGIMQKVAADSGNMGQAIAQFGIRGVNVYDMLAKRMGVSQAEAQAMVKAGEVSFEEFTAAVADGTANMGEAMASTFGGLVKNIGSNMGRVGENITGPLLEASKIIMGPVLEALRGLASGLAPIREQFESWLIPLAEKWAASLEKIDFSNLDVSNISGPISWLVDNLGGIATLSLAALGPLLSNLPLVGKYFSGLTGPVGAVIGFFIAMFTESQSLRDAFGGIMGVIGDLAPTFGLIIGAVAELISNFAKLAGDSLGNLITALLPTLAILLEGAANAILFIVDQLSSLVEWLNQSEAAMSIISGTLVALVAGFGLFKGAMIAHQVATTAAAAAQKVFNLVMSANPIGLVITAIAALVAGLIYFFTQTETGQKIVKNFLQWMKEAWSNISNFLSGLWDTISGAFTAAWQGISDFFIGIWDGIKGAAESVGDWFNNTIVPVFTAAWDGIQAAAQAVSDWYTNNIAPVFETIWNGIVTAAEAAAAWYQEHLAPVFEAVGELIMAVWDRVKENAEILWTGLQVIWDWIVQGWTNLWNAAQAAWDAVGAPIADFVAKTWDTMKQAAQITWDTILGILETVWNSIKSAVETAIDFVKNIVETVWDAISNTTDSVWSKISDFLSETWDKIQSHIDNVINVVKNVIETAWKVIETTSQTIWNNIRNVIDTVWNVIKTVIETVLGVIKGIINTVTNLIKGDWEGAWNSIKGIFETIWNGIKQVGETILNGIKNFIENQINGIKSTWNTVWGAVKKFFSDTWNSIKNAATNFMNSVKDKFNEVMSFVRGIPDKILNSFKNMSNLLKSSGRALVDGFLTGIKNAWSRLTGWVSEGIQKVRNLFPFSPAKEGPFSGRGWVDRAGESLGETFIDSTSSALEQGVRYINSAMKDISGAMHVTSQGMGIQDVGLSMAEQLAAGMSRGVSVVRAAAMQLAASARSGIDSIGGPELHSSGFNGAVNRFGAPTPAGTSTDNSRSIVIERGAIQVNGGNSERTGMEVLDRLVEELDL